MDSNHHVTVSLSATYKIEGIHACQNHKNNLPNITPTQARTIKIRLNVLVFIFLSTSFLAYISNPRAKSDQFLPTSLYTLQSHLHDTARGRTNRSMLIGPLFYTERLIYAARLLPV